MVTSAPNGTFDDEDDLPRLKISCTSSDCERDLHCFREIKRMAPNERGACRYCGVDLVDWERVRTQDPTDAQYTFAALRTELIRHHFWHKDVGQKAINHARRKGKTGMREAATSRIRSSVGRAQAELFRDGTQTPMDGDNLNLIHYAQHATASCCRTCIEEWHGIPRDRALTEGEVRYLRDLAMLYIEERLPDLAEDGIRVPPMRPKVADRGRQ